MKSDGTEFKKYMDYVLNGYEKKSYEEIFKEKISAVIAYNNNPADEIPMPTPTIDFDEWAAEVIKDHTQWTRQIHTHANCLVFAKKPDEFSGVMVWICGNTLETNRWTALKEHRNRKLKGFQARLTSNGINTNIKWDVKANLIPPSMSPIDFAIEEFGLTFLKRLDDIETFE